eukprot:gene7159-8879_t
MGHEHEGGRAALTGEFFEEAEEFFARHGIEAGARFVEDEQAGAGHEGSGDEDALAFPLGEELPLAVHEPGNAEGAQEFFGVDDVGAGGREPEVELGVTATDDRLNSGLGSRDAGLERAGDDADFGAEIAPVGFAVAVAEEGDVAGAGGKVAEKGLEEGGLAAAVAAEDDPVFAALHAPVEAVEDDVIAPGHAE